MPGGSGGSGGSGAPSAPGASAGAPSASGTGGAPPLTNVAFTSSVRIRVGGEDRTVTSFNEFAVIAGQSGISPSYIVSLRRNASATAATTARLVALMAWGPNRLDSQGTPCSGYCAANCETGVNPLLMPACGATVACPPAGTAGYRIKFTTRLRKTLAQFDVAARTTFKTNLAAYLSSFGAAINATSDITLTVTSSSRRMRMLQSGGSVSVESSIETSSALGSLAVNSAVTNLTAEAAQLYIDPDISSVSAPQKVTVAGSTGSLGAPPPSSDDALGSSSNGKPNIGGTIGGIFGGIFGIVMLGVCIAWVMSMKQKTPLASQQPVVSVHTGASVKTPPPGAHRASNVGITQPSDAKKAEDVELADKEGDEAGKVDEDTSKKGADEISSRSDD